MTALRNVANRIYRAPRKRVREVWVQGDQLSSVRSGGTRCTPIEALPEDDGDRRGVVTHYGAVVSGFKKA